MSRRIKNYAIVSLQFVPSASSWLSSSLRSTSFFNNLTTCSCTSVSSSSTDLLVKKDYFFSFERDAAFLCLLDQFSPQLKIMIIFVRQIGFFTALSRFQLIHVIADAFEGATLAVSKDRPGPAAQKIRHLLRGLHS